MFISIYIEYQIYFLTKYQNIFALLIKPIGSWRLNDIAMVLS